MASVRRTDTIGANVETLLPPVRQGDAIGANVETLLQPMRRVSALGVLLEIALAPAPPINLTATAISTTRIDLAWDDQSATETGFKIERGTNGVTFAQIDTVSADVEAYSDTTVLDCRHYYYRVRAYVEEINGNYSNIADAVTMLAAPTLLTATAGGYEQINLAWTDNSGAETGFEVERSLTGSGGWSQIGTTVANDTTYSDATATGNVTYYYRVRAVNLLENSTYSNTASLTLGDFMVTEIANTLITLMEADTDLSAVLLFIRGGTPFVVPQDQTPFCEVIIGEETPIEELIGCVSTHTYRGLITFTVQVTQQAAADWLSPVGSDARRANVGSYDLIKRLVMVAQTELQRYPSLNNLTTTVVLSDQTIREVVTGFRFDGSIVYGLDDRADNYENFGSLPFIAETERTIS